MTIERINLQNTPTVESVDHEDVVFRRQDFTLQGRLYRPAKRAERLPGVVVAGAWTTVKEQMAGTYARALAQQGFAALAFDFTGWGASDGEPRYVENPAVKTADIAAAVDFLARRDDIDRERIFGLGICASSGYMAAVAADNPMMMRLALVAPWLHDPRMAEATYGGPEQVKTLIELGRDSQRANDAQVIVAASTKDERALMFQAPYFTEADRGLIAEYDNRFSVSSWEPWLTYDAQAVADRLLVPTLIVCSESAALPAGAHAFAKRTKAPATELWLDDVSQFDFYDRADVVTTSIAAVVDHFEGRAQ